MSIMYIDRRQKELRLKSQQLTSAHVLNIHLDVALLFSEEYDTANERRVCKYKQQSFHVLCICTRWRRKWCALHCSFFCGRSALVMVLDWSISDSEIVPDKCFFHIRIGLKSVLRGSLKHTFNFFKKIQRLCQVLFFYIINWPRILAVPTTIQL